jgi:tRNA pseudouridine55 synthase
MNHKKDQKISLNGWLNIDKPVGVSSTFITNKLKRILNPKKIGHAGTLDPAASGILPIALGEATKTIEYTQDAKKAYQFTVKFGETTDTLDSEGKIIEKNDILPKLKDLENVIPEFIGKIKQTPPAFSAIKINGQRAYDLARKGEEFEIKQREIEIYSLKLLKHKTDDNQYVTEATFEAQCSKGTYIRTLGADIAKATQAIGYIIFLRRIMVGNFNENEALKLEYINEDLILRENEIKSHLKPIDVGLDDIPVLHLDKQACIKLRNGLKIPTDSKIAGIARVYDEKKLTAIAEIENGFVIPKKVFNL